MAFDEKSENTVVKYSFDHTRYERYIKKIIKHIPNLKKNVLPFLLINNRIDENGLWLEFGKGIFNNTNQISHYTKNILYHFTKNSVDDKFYENVEIIEGELEENLKNFKKSILTDEKKTITFLCINYYDYNTVYKILSTLCENLDNNCIIVFDKLINYSDYQSGSLKAFYHFLHVSNIKYEWIGTNGSVFKIIPREFDAFLNTNNSGVGILIKNNPRLRKIEKSSYDDYIYNIFNWEKYIKYYPDLSNITAKEDAWDHWKISGIHENRIFFSLETGEEKYFDWEKYTDTNNDLKELYTKDLAWQHWIKYGMSEGRTYFSLEREEEKYFDWETYVVSYSDLKDITTKKDAWDHWTKHGLREGRTYFQLSGEKLKRTYSNHNILPDFDWIYYTKKYEDLSDINTELDAWIHWNVYGKNENRTVTFDWVTYLSNLDLHSNNLNSKETAFEHWLKNGKKKFELPHEFYWLNYLIKNPDLEALIITENDAKYHWLNIGQYENRIF